MSIANEPLGAKHVLVCVVISLSVTGFFVGLQSPVKPPAEVTAANTLVAANTGPAVDTESGVVPATPYDKMAQVIQQMHDNPTAAMTAMTADVVSQSPKPSMAEKLAALEGRQRNRAFNGAPPTIPHSTASYSASHCLACHGDGANMGSLRISKMSHPYLTNCTQCHVEESPDFQSPSKFRDSGFVGLEAPTQGPRAFPFAPPQIPHSTWMREDCLSCHGAAGPRGLQTTHPWRSSCQQCHTPSAGAEQLPWTHQRNSPR